MYYVAKTKALISFAVTAKLTCVFVFAYAKSRFSHDEAHLCHVTSKPVLRVSNHVRHETGCTATENGQRLGISYIGSRGIVLSM